MRRAALLVALAACGDDAPATCPTGWSAARSATGGALLAGFGDADDGWLVGGELGDGGPLLLRWRGGALAEVALDGDASLWWGWRAPDGEVWLVGERGLVLRGGDAGFTPVGSGTTETLYGVWGSAPDDVWIVGGADTVLRWDGAALAPAAPAPRGADLFKVWGSAADDVWIVGEGGTAWRWTGAAFEPHHGALGELTRLTTVHGCAADEVYAAGGPGAWRWDGAAWARMPNVADTALTTGVACGEREVLVVGLGGLKVRIDRETGAVTDEQGAAPLADFHGAWAPSGGELWALGGEFLRPAGGGTRRGVAARYCP